VLFYQVLQQRVLLIIRKGDAQHLGVRQDVVISAPQPSSISSGWAPINSTRRPKKVISWFIPALGYFTGQETADDFGHHQLAFSCRRRVATAAIWSITG
jgi:hypothetical protein